MELIRKHLMIEGQIAKECLVTLLDEVIAVYSKLAEPSSPCRLPDSDLSTRASQSGPSRGYSS